MSDSDNDRYRAELRLLDTIHALVVHELGNPLQAMIVLLELTRDELEDSNARHPGIARLDRALASIDRLRRVLMTSSQLRVESDGQPVNLGGILDSGLLLLGRRLEALEVEIVRETEALDDAQISPAMAQALVSALLGVAEQIRSRRESGLELELQAATSDGQLTLRLRLCGANGRGAIRLEPTLVAAARELVAGVEGCSCDFDGSALTLVSGRL